MDALHSNKRFPSQSVQTTGDLSLNKEADIANKGAFLSQLAEKDGSQGAEIAKNIILKDPMFMAGTGISSLGYTFLLFQIFSDLEISLLESGLKQTALNNAMYQQLKEIELKAADDIWLSGLAKGISQITGAVGQLGISAYSARAQNNVLKTNEAVVTGAPTAAPQPPQAQVGGTAGQPAPAPAVPQTAQAQVEGTVVQPAPAPQPAGGSNNHAPQNDGRVSKEKQAKMNSIAEKYVLLGRAFHDMAIGAGSVGGAWYDADAKKLEGIKHLIQMVIENTNTSKQRAQQQYDEAAKQIEAAIQAYNAAANASH